MEIIKTADFDSAFDELPKNVQRLYHVQEKRFLESWHDSRLHVKKIKGLPDVFSFRVTRRYRVFFYFKVNDTIIFFEVDHRKDIYR